jgi:hypothetical protein
MTLIQKNSTKCFIIHSTHWNPSFLVNSSTIHYFYTCCNVRDAIAKLCTIQSYIQDYITTAFILEDLICLAATSLSQVDIDLIDPNFQKAASDLIDFYSRAELHPKQIKLACQSLAQIHSGQYYYYYFTIPIKSLPIPF